MTIYETCKIVIRLKSYSDKEDYQKRLNILMAVNALTLEEYTELTELLDNKES